MVTEAPIRSEVKVLVTYPLVNDHIYLNEAGAVDTVDLIRADGLHIPIGSANMIRTAALNIPIGSRLYLHKNSTYNPSLFVEAGYFSSFDFDDNTATFGLDECPRHESIKNIIEDVIFYPNDYELFAKLSIRITKNGHVKFDKGRKSFFFLKNKRYIISQEFKSTTDGKRKFYITWTER